MIKDPHKLFKESYKDTIMNCGNPKVKYKIPVL